MSLGSFILIKNEAPWIAAHLLMWLPHLDEMVFFDGNSTDGTLEIIKAIQRDNPHGHKIKLFEDRDPADLRDSYTRLFNAALHALTTDLAFFLHPDMIPEPGGIPATFDTFKNCIAASVKVRAFAGNPEGPLLEVSGRELPNWKSIHRLRNPDLGAHYHGWYGAWNEDVYFSFITGNDHTLYENIEDYPHEITPSGIEILHFSDVRHYGRRFGRMRTCLMNQGHDPKMVYDLAAGHPRVTLKDGWGLSFHPAEYPAEFLAARKQYAHLEKQEEPVCV